MNQRACNRFVFILVCVALLSAMVSPACAFLSGAQDRVQICNAAGDVVSVSAASLAADEAVPAQTGTDQAGRSQLECGFCFMQAHIKPATLSIQSVLFFQGRTESLLNKGFARFEISGVAAYKSRAPPVNLA